MKEIMLRFLLFMVSFNGVSLGIHLMSGQWFWVGFFAVMTLGFLYNLDQEPDADSTRQEWLTSRGVALLLTLASAGMGVNIARMDAVGLVGLFIHGFLGCFFTYKLYEMKHEPE